MTRPSRDVFLRHFFKTNSASSVKIEDEQQIWREIGGVPMRLTNFLKQPVQQSNAMSRRRGAFSAFEKTAQATSEKFDIELQLGSFYQPKQCTIGEIPQNHHIALHCLIPPKAWVIPCIILPPTLDFGESKCQWN